MENKYSIPSLDSYIAKYMDENGCSLEEACSALEINSDNAFQEVNTNLNY